MTEWIPWPSILPTKTNKIPVLWGIHIKQKQKWKFSLMFVAYSLTCFHFSLIFFAFSAAFAWCEQALRSQKAVHDFLSYSVWYTSSRLSERLPWGQAVMAPPVRTVNLQEIDRRLVLGIISYIIFLHVSTFGQKNWWIFCVVNKNFF